MAKILNFEDFVKENQVFDKLFNDNSTFELTKEHKTILYKTILENCVLDLNESRSLERILNEETLYEGLFSKIADKTKDILGKVSDELKKAGKDFITEIIKESKKIVGNSKDDVIKKVKGMGENTTKSLKEETTYMSDTFNFYTKFITSGVVKLAQTAYQQTFKVIKTDDDKNESFSIYDDIAFYAVIETIKNNNYNLLELNEELDNTLKYLNTYTINESDDHHGIKIPFLSSIKKFLQKAPIFKQLGQLEEKAADIAKNTLHKASVYAKALGGPGVYEFVAISILIGAMVEYKVKSAASSLVTYIIPGIGPIVGIIGTVAVGITLVSVVEHLLKSDKDEEH